MCKLKQGLSTKEASRKLVSIQQINDIQPIPKADKIEVASVLGWKVVIPKNVFKVGDKVVFFAIDSFLPDTKDFEFLGTPHRNPITIGTENVEVGHRLSTVKLKGQISQGLIKALSDFNISNNIEVGTDVTDILGVTKYSKPEVQTNFGKSLAEFPTWLVDKTDEIRVQDKPKSYYNLKNKQYYITYKYDGTSITVASKTEEDGTKKLIVASRNKTLAEGTTIHKWLTETGLDKKVLNYKQDIVLQGEFYGEKIQNNRLGINGNRYAVFNIERNHQRLGLKEMLKVANDLDLEITNIFEVGITDIYEKVVIETLLKKINKNRTNLRNNDDYGKAEILLDNNRSNVFNYSIEDLIELANGIKYHNNLPAEGLVVRPLNPDTEKDSFKVINNKYILKYKL